MKTEKLDRNGWNIFFDGLSKSLEGKRASIEIASLDIGDQIEADSVQLYGITYDPKDNLLEVALEGLDHMIANPQDIEVVSGEQGIETIGVVDGDGKEQIIRLTSPLMLAPPA